MNVGLEHSRSNFVSEIRYILFSECSISPPKVAWTFLKEPVLLSSKIHVLFVSKVIDVSSRHSDKLEVRVACPPVGLISTLNEHVAPICHKSIWLLQFRLVYVAYFSHFNPNLYGEGGKFAPPPKAVFCYSSKTVGARLLKLCDFYC